MKNKNTCIITRIWPSVEDMKKDIIIDLEKQTITRISTNNELSKFIRNKKGNRTKYYAVGIGINGKTHILSVHRLFFYWKYGYLPKIVDHKDTDSTNNKIENLREINSSGNATNRNKSKKRQYSSIHKGVTWSKEKSKWKTAFQNNFIGYYDLEDDAGQAYNDKIRELGLEEISVLNDTLQEKARKINQFDPLPKEIESIKNLF